jgi:ubiquinone/menaquinone biosynthesis C-methylase UbiE
MTETDPETQRNEMLDRWESAAVGWGRRAHGLRQLGISSWMIEQLALQPGQQVLELAAGPGDTGFLAAELVRPGGRLISSDATEAMLEIARRRAGEMGIDNVEFRRLELEWIDLPTATVDAALCRFGVMLILDPGAALREIRRVLRPGGRIALAVWDAPARNPWATIPTRALTELGHGSRPDPAAPGMFALADRERLRELLEEAGFVEVRVEPLEAPRSSPSVKAFIDETVDLSFMFAAGYNSLREAEQVQVRDRIASLLEPFTAEDGSIALPGSALGAAADA